MFYFWKASHKIILCFRYKLDFDRPYKRITRPRHQDHPPKVRRPLGQPIQVLVNDVTKRSSEPRTLAIVDPLEVNETSQNTQIVVIDANGVEHEVVDAPQDKLEALLSAAVEQNIEVNMETDGSDNEEYNLVVADQDQYIIVNEDQVIQTICSDTGQTESIQIQFIDWYFISLL